MASTRARTRATKATDDGLDERTVAPLRQRARKESITGAGRMRKAELLRALRASQRSTTAKRRPASKTRPKRSTSADTASRALSQRRSRSGSSTSSKRTKAGQAEDEDYRGQTLVTRDHDVMRAWAEARGAVPATVAGRRRGGRLGVLRLDFPAYGGDNLEKVSWEEWFETFDSRDLDAVYQERTSKGQTSNFFRLVREDN